MDAHGDGYDGRDESDESSVEAKSQYVIVL